jgi:hypothetical protein
MCFSAGASFAAGAVILAVGIASVREVQKPSQRVFAIIPLLFAIQQLAEGCLWLSLQSPDYELVKKISTYIFMVTAQVLWPVVIPLSVLLMEEQRKRRKILRVLLVIGISLSLYYAFFLFFFKVTAEILSCHILYGTESPDSIALPIFIFYLAVTIAPLFISSIKKMKILGILMFLSCVAGALFYKVYLTSIWCFFAAIISAYIFLILREPKKP